MNREEWLTAAIEELRPLFDAQGRALPEKIRVTCGFPSTKARTLTKAIGEHWHADASADGTHEILISPVIADRVQVLAVLVHELIHAAMPRGEGHGKNFLALARALWLEGKATATVPGDAFRENFRPIMDGLGEYPHAELHVSLLKQTQTTRMLKASCPCCGYKIRITRKWADIGLPDCPVDGETLQLEEKE